MVLSTPNGSTAYNYAAGGPVLSPSAACTVITPVAPMAGIGRPVVLGAGDRVSLTVASDSAPVAVDVDGTPAGELKPGDVLTARLREDAAQVVRLSAGEHASRSRVKLSLLDLPLRRDQLLELIPAELRENAELSVRRCLLKSSPAERRPAAGRLRRDGVDGSGGASGLHFRSEVFALSRLGNDPSVRYAAIASSTQALPNSEPACVVPPTPSISADAREPLADLEAAGERRGRVQRLADQQDRRRLRAVHRRPACRPSRPRSGTARCTRRCPRSRTAPGRWTRQLSLVHFVQDGGHCTSVHWTAR